MRIGSMTTVLQSSSVPRVKILYVLALITALTSFLFCGIFLGLLLHNFFLPQPPAATGEPTFVNAQGVPVFSSDPSYRQPATDSFNSLPTDNPDFLQLKRKLAENRTDEKLISATREKDQSLRQTYFSRREFIEQTDHWLLVAAVTFLISTTAIAVLRRKLPFPRAEGISETRRQEQLRLQKNLLAWLVFSGLLVGLALGGIAMTDNSLERMLVAKTQPIKPHPPLPSDVDRVVANDAADTSALTTPEPPLNRNAFVGQLAANWPSFRGFDCTGSGATSAEKTLMPTQWQKVY